MGPTNMSCLCICKRVSPRHEVRGLQLDAATCRNALCPGLSLAEIEALFAGDVYIVRDTIVSGERRILGFGDGAGH